MAETELNLGTRLLATSSPVQRPESISDPDNHRELYIDFIRACYALYPDSEQYYEKLVQYLSQRATRSPSSLQKLNVYNVRKDFEACRNPYSVFFNTSLEGSQSTPRIIILEGFPCPIFMARLGSQNSLRPEFFISHLDLERKQSQRYSLYELPTIPSKKRISVHVILAILIKDLVHSVNFESYTERRAQAEVRCRESEKQLFDQARYGATRFRKIHIHNSQFCSVEQMASFTVSVDGASSWNGIFLLDHGRSDENPQMPWSWNQKKWRPLGSLPIVPYNGTVLNTPTRPLQSETGQKMLTTLDDFHPFKHITVNDCVDQSLLLEDPFFLLSSLLTSAALSWSQLINYVESDIKSWLGAPPEHLSFALEQIQFNTGLIDRIEESLIENLDIIRLGGCTAWPKAASPQTQARKTKLQSTLQEDCSSLITRCNRLTKKCEGISGILVSSAQLSDAQKGIEQAQQVHALTRLAFVFIPMNFVASFFGMNLAQLSGNIENPSIWIFFVISILLTGFAWLAVSWDDYLGPAGKVRLCYRAIWRLKQ